jgi:hypothetical protein
MNRCEFKDTTADARMVRLWGAIREIHRRLG